MKRLSQGDDRTAAYIYAPNNGAPNYIKQELVERRAEMTSDVITLGGFNTPLTSVGRSSRQTVNLEIKALNVM